MTKRVSGKIKIIVEIDDSDQLDRNHLRRRNVWFSQVSREWWHVPRKNAFFPRESGLATKMAPTGWYETSWTYLISGLAYTSCTKITTSTTTTVFERTPPLISARENSGRREEKKFRGSGARDARSVLLRFGSTFRGNRSFAYSATATCSARCFVIDNGVWGPGARFYSPARDAYASRRLIYGGGWETPSQEERAVGRGLRTVGLRFGTDPGRFAQRCEPSFDEGGGLDRSHEARRTPGRLFTRRPDSCASYRAVRFVAAMGRCVCTFRFGKCLFRAAITRVSPKFGSL